MASFAGLGALFPGLSSTANIVLTVIIAFIAIILLMILRDDNITIHKLIKNIEEHKE